MFYLRSFACLENILAYELIPVYSFIRLLKLARQRGTAGFTRAFAASSDFSISHHRAWSLGRVPLCTYLWDHCLFRNRASEAIRAIHFLWWRGLKGMEVKCSPESTRQSWNLVFVLAGAIIMGELLKLLGDSFSGNKLSIYFGSCKNSIRQWGKMLGLD